MSSTTSKVIQNRTKDAISWKQIVSGGHIRGNYDRKKENTWPWTLAVSVCVKKCYRIANLYKTIKIEDSLSENYGCSKGKVTEGRWNLKICRPKTGSNKRMYYFHHQPYKDNIFYKTFP